MRALVVCLVLLLTQSAQADGQVPFPELNTEAYCTDLVSKMLDKAEQKIELNKCLVDEAALKLKVETFWRFANPASQRYVIQNHFKDERNQTYMTLASYTERGVGIACLEGRVDCHYPADFFRQLQVVPQLDSEAYCSAAFAEEADKTLRFAKITECLDLERKTKNQLQPFWRVVHPRMVEYCKDFVSHITRHSYRALSMCVAGDIGAPCVRGTIECSPRN